MTGCKMDLLKQKHTGATGSKRRRQSDLENVKGNDFNLSAYILLPLGEKKTYNHL